MKILYDFPLTEAGQSYTVRNGDEANSTILAAAFVVPVTGRGRVEFADPVAATEIWFRNEGTGEALPYDVFDPAVSRATALINERLAHSEQLPPGPVEFYPDTEGEDFVWVDVFTIDFIGAIEGGVQVKIELIDKTVAYEESGFPETYSQTLISDADGRARFKLAKGSAIRPLMSGATHKGKIKNQTFYLRPADAPGKASKMLVAAK